LGGAFLVRRSSLATALALLSGLALIPALSGGAVITPGRLGFDEWVSADNFFHLDPVLGRNGVPEKSHGDSVGRLRAALRELGVAEDTIVWYLQRQRPRGRPAEHRLPPRRQGEVVGGGLPRPRARRMARSDPDAGGQLGSVLDARHLPDCPRCHRYGGGEKDSALDGIKLLPVDRTDARDAAAPWRCGARRLGLS
jgi:hypothetical protein